MSRALVTLLLLATPVFAQDAEPGEWTVDKNTRERLTWTYSYDENQMMRCSFEDAGTGRKSTIDMSMAKSDGESVDEIDKFLVE